MPPFEIREEVINVILADLLSDRGVLLVEIGGTTDWNFLVLRKALPFASIGSQSPGDR